MKRIVVMTAAVIAAASPIAISSAFAAEEEEPSPLCAAVTDLGNSVHEATNLNLLGTAETEACSE